MKKALPIGRDSFRDLMTGKKENYYVDKTLMIKDFIDYNNAVSLITRPRRFGKTLNMTMLRDFFDIEQDSLGIFANLNIMKTEYADEINTRPVIFLTFKNCSGENINEMCIALAKAIRSEYLKYETIFSKSVDPKSNDYFAFYKTYDMLREVSEDETIDETGIVQKRYKVDRTLLKSSLTELIKSVCVFYNKMPLLLIDEYDQPLIKAHEMGYREAFSKVIYGSFLGSALKGNDYLGQALLTGIQRVVKESIFSEVNNFVVYTVLSKKYSTYFGLTHQETKELLEHCDLELDQNVVSYYDGYSFSGLDIYNPWSILNYANEQKLQSYWSNTSTNGLIKEAIPKADKGFHVNFERLILNKEIRVSSNLETAFVELATPQTLWGLLVNAGYLTVTKVFRSGATQIKIPNEEVKKEFREIVAAYTKVQANQLEDLFNALIDGEMEEFLRLYQALVYDYVSYHDVKDGEKTSSKHLENSYHMLFLGMSISVSGLYEITSNLEAGQGRGDIIMKSLQPELRPHIIVELKEGDNAPKLKQEALEQIFAKKYYVKLRGSVLCVGLAHSMKECELVHREIVVNGYGEIS